MVDAASEDGLCLTSIEPWNGETSTACSFGLRKGTDEFNKGSANWFLFDREKAAHKGWRPHGY